MAGKKGKVSEEAGCQFSHVRRVLVVGAGVAGLQTTKRLLQLNFNTLCIEKSGSFGGVWSRNFTGFKTQVPWQHYQFPDFPFPTRLAALGRYPSGPHIQEYVQEYVAHFKLAPYIQMNCQLVQLKQHPVTQTWLAVYYNGAQDKFYKIWVEFVVIATGIYNQPYIPECLGSNKFKGVQVHSRDFQDLSVLQGKRVVIVGAGKTALDCVAEVVAAGSARTVTMLFRQPHWPIPRKVCGVSTRCVLHSRVLQSFVAPYYTEQRRWKHALHRHLKPFKSLLWRTLERASVKQFHLTPDRLPAIDLQDDMQHTGIVLDNSFDALVRQAGNVQLMRGELHILAEHGVILKDGSYHEADVILYCTGYRKSYEFLPGALQRKLEMQKDGLYLYRNMMAPGVPNLAFIGCEAATYNNILTSGLQSLWLAHLLTGRLPLPATEVMEADVAAQRRWKRELFPDQRTRGSAIMLYMQFYHDQLAKDMAIKRKRKGWHILSEAFGTYTAMDYESTFAACDAQLRAQNPDNRRLAPSFETDNDRELTTDKRDDRDSLPDSVSYSRTSGGQGKGSFTLGAMRGSTDSTSVDSCA